MSPQATTRACRLALLSALTGLPLACSQGRQDDPQIGVTSSLPSATNTVPNGSASIGGVHPTAATAAPLPSTAELPVLGSVGAEPSSTGATASSSSSISISAPGVSANPTQSAAGVDAGAPGGESTDAAAASSASPSSDAPDDGRGPHAPLEGEIEVLFDGSGFEAWEPVDDTVGAVNWVLNPTEGSMQVTPTYTNHIVTRQEYLHRDVFLHIEFWSPNESSNQMGQDRGNSGIYLQSRYEVQVLDTFGRGPEIDGCGAIYKVSAPLVNACKPAEQWNTYEIDFTAPRFESGLKVENARVTAWLNEQLVQEDVEVPGPTQAGEPDEVDAAQPLYLQDHGDTVRYRNIWWIRR